MHSLAPQTENNSAADAAEPAPEQPQQSTRHVLEAVLILAGAAVLAYSDSFGCHFILDDGPGIEGNPSIRSLWPLWNVLRPPRRTFLTGHPLVNLSFALNYAVSALNVWSYHVVNLLIHVLSGLTLYGVVRRSFAWPSMRARYDRQAAGTALVCALIWLVHPLQTEAVTYIARRRESMMGMFFLLTVYCAVRGWQSAKPKRWHILAVTACAAGGASEGTIIVAPLLVLAYDLVFVHAGVREALRRSVWLYAGLAACTVAMAFFMVPRSEWAHAAGAVAFTPLEYALSQSKAISHYVRLALWPRPLCLDYWWQASTFSEALPSVIALLSLAAVSVHLLRKRHPAGLAACWFFATLAPTSSIVPLPDIISEHRMYLPLAGLVVLAVFGGQAALQRLGRRAGRARMPAYTGLLAVCLVVALYTSVTFRRNQDYRTDISIWEDTVAKQPDNPRARYCLGTCLGNVGKFRRAVPHLREAARMSPDFPDGYFNLGVALAQSGRVQEAIASFEHVLRLNPRDRRARRCLRELRRKTAARGTEI